MLTIALRFFTVVNGVVGVQVVFRGVNREYLFALGRPVEPAELEVTATVQVTDYTASGEPIDSPNLQYVSA